MISLRDRLQTLLEDALARLAEAETPEPGLLRLIADTSRVLGILDQLEAKAELARVTREPGSEPR